jgi:hypothetical protein
VGRTAASYGGAAGSLAIVLFVAGGVLAAGQPGFDASGPEIAAHLDENRARIQVACVLYALMAPLLVWFLAAVASFAEEAGEGARRCARLAFALGTAFVTLFLADVTTLAVSALRPEEMAAAPELARALRGFEWLAMGMAAPLVVGMLLAYAVLALREGAVLPRWVGWMAAIAAPLYALRIGTLFGDKGAFAADGVLGLVVPVAAIGLWVLLASVALTLEPAPRPGKTQSPSI